METITICRNSGRTRLAVSIMSKNILLEDDIILKVDENEKKITITRATIDYDKGKKKPTKCQAGWFRIFYNNNLPLGKYKIEPEESDIDTLTIFY